MNEKGPSITASDDTITSILLERSPSPPRYEHVMKNNPPPPSYIHSTVRLQYHNQPYITDMEQYAFRHQYETRNASAAGDMQSDNFSAIAKLPFRKRLTYYARSWLTTLHEGRLRPDRPSTVVKLLEYFRFSYNKKRRAGKVFLAQVSRQKEAPKSKWT
ncbi:hypothetical protein BD560DRAFT_426412 [Blakeslea trispora]|nr:hypothetical protein BD560DRAFT_426412 [Blakeslea trispora]